MNERRGAGRRGFSAVFAVAGAFLLAGCGGAAPPPAHAPDTPPAAPPGAPAASPEGPDDADAAAIAAPPSAAAGAAGAPAAPPSPPTGPAPIAEALQPLSRPLLAVTLPGVQSLTSVHGRSPRDIWFIDATPPTGEYTFRPEPQGAVIHYDGRRVVGRYKPSRSCAYGFFGIVVGKDEAKVLGSNLFYRGVAPSIRATLSRDGKFSCSDAGYTSGLTVSSGDLIWTLDCQGYGTECSLQASGGPPASLPAMHASFTHDGEGAPLAFDTLSMRGADDGFMTSHEKGGRARLFRYNGVTWVPQATLDAGLAVVDLWVDEEAHVWLTVRRGGKDEDPANAVLRFDGRALHPLALPAGFKARWVRGTGARDVWFVGAGRAVYQWDGQRLRQGEAPLDVGDAWSSPGGEVWVVGTHDPKPGDAVAARTAPLAEVQ